MRVFDRDPFVGRVERTALTACLAAAVAALVVRGGRPDVALGVLGGGLLSAASYWAIRSAIDALVRALVGSPAATVSPAASLPAGPSPAPPEHHEGPARGVVEAGGEEAGKATPRRRTAAASALVRLAGRYALLAFLAYVMIARFRLHPIGLLIGVSSLPFAASVEAVRAVRGPGRPPSP